MLYNIQYITNCMVSGCRDWVAQYLNMCQLLIDLLKVLKSIQTPVLIGTYGTLGIY